MKPRPCFIQTLSSGLLTPSASCQIKCSVFVLFVCCRLWIHQTKVEGGMNLSYESLERTTPSPSLMHRPQINRTKWNVLKFFHTEIEVNNYSYFFEFGSEEYASFPLIAYICNVTRSTRTGLHVPIRNNNEEWEILVSLYFNLEKENIVFLTRKFSKTEFFPTFSERGFEWEQPT